MSITLARVIAASVNLTSSKSVEATLSLPNSVFSFEVDDGPIVIAPVADFVGSVVSGNAPLTVNFTDLSTNTPTSWSWDFGDATTSTAQNPTKIYTVPGVYTVTLIATNAAGSDTRIRASYIVAAFNPASLFTGGFLGGFYDASDLSTLWQDSARTTPVTADGDPVGAWDDKSGNGRHFTQATAGFRPLYRTSGGLHWLEFDGVDDRMLAPTGAIMGATGMTSFIGVRFDKTTGTQFTLNADDGGTRIAQIFRHVSNTFNTIAFGGGSPFTDFTGITSAAGVDYVQRVDVTTTTVEALSNRITNGTTALSGALNTSSFALRLSDAGNLLDGRVYAVLNINKPCTSTEKANVENFFATKSGVTL